MVLRGIKMAAITGCKVPVRANDKPITFYNKEITKLALTIDAPALA